MRCNRCGEQDPAEIHTCTPRYEVGDITPMLKASGIHADPVHIIRIAKESGLSIPLDHVTEEYFKALAHFATLVAAAEREACAQILDHNANACANNSVLRDVLQGNATAIRARGQA